MDAGRVAIRWTPEAVLKNSPGVRRSGDGPGVRIAILGDPGGGRKTCFRLRRPMLTGTPSVFGRDRLAPPFVLIDGQARKKKEAEVFLFRTDSNSYFGRTLAAWGFDLF